MRNMCTEGGYDRIPVNEDRPRQISDYRRSNRLGKEYATGVCLRLNIPEI